MSIALAANNNVITESVYGNRFLFQGREYDYATQLYYFRNRWYEPETGRWLSPDPIGISGGLNLYVFCGNDPVNFVDPMGENVFFCQECELGGHGWVKIGGTTPRGKDGYTVGGVPSGSIWGSQMKIQSPDAANDRTNKIWYKEVKTTPEIEEKLKKEIQEKYFVENANKDEFIEEVLKEKRLKNPYYRVHRYNCRDLRDDIYDMLKDLMKSQK